MGVRLDDLPERCDPELELVGVGGAEVERASFFGLEDLYREKLARAEELRTRFRGSDVETASAAAR